MLWKGFQRPKRLEFERETLTDRFGRFYAQPFERGFGTTIGNALRRVLLSSIEGAAITAVKIDGVLHEFSPIPGVVEDATDIILNLKQIPLKLHTDHTKTLILRVDKPGEVRARDIQADGDVEILEPDAHIATVAEGGKLHMEMRMKRGRGYVSADKNFDEDLGIGWIPIDSVHSPIKKVNYLVEAARLGQTTDYDKLTVDVWTNGSISARDAVSLSAKLIRDHLNIFINLEEGVEPQGDAAGDQPRDGRRQREPRQVGRGARAVGAVLQLPEEREHPHDSRARAEDRSRDAEDEELRPQEPERDQGNPAHDGAQPRHAGRRRAGVVTGQDRTAMRHRVAHRKLGRVTEHRIAMLRNQATALLRHEHLTTTVPKAKELRPFVERLITIAKRGLASGDRQRARAERAAARDAGPAGPRGRDEAVRTLAPRFEARPGGYTRLLRLGFRRGDAAEVAQVELVGSEFNPRAKAEADAKTTEAAPKAKGVGGRLRAAADRLRGKKDEPGGDVGKKAQTKPSKGVRQKSTTPRKAGGS